MVNPESAPSWYDMDKLWRRMVYRKRSRMWLFRDRHGRFISKRDRENRLTMQIVYILFYTLIICAIFYMVVLTMGERL